MPKVILISPGTLFGKLTVVREGPRADTSQRQRQFLCRCVCGSTRLYRLAYLRIGDTKCCGCIPRGRGRK